MEVRCGGLDALDFPLHRGELFLEVVGRGSFLFQCGPFFLQTLDLGPRGDDRFPQFLADDGAVGDPDAGKNAGDGVVVFGGDGIGFVVVASGAAEGESEKGAADGVDPFLPFFGDGDADDLGRELQFFPIAGAEADETEGGVVLRPGIGEKVVGELADHKLIVGEVVVEGRDDPVAVEKRRALGIQPRFGDVGVAGEVEPVPSPALAVVGRGEEFLHGFGEAGAVEIFHLLRRRGQPGEIEMETSQEDAVPGRSGGRESGFLHLREEEGVDAVLRPGIVGDGRERPLRERLEGPGQLLGVFPGIGPARGGEGESDDAPAETGCR